jgi:alanine racemase
LVFPVETRLPQRPTWAEIDLDALAHNLREARGRVAEGVSVMAVVKANAYGHGAVACARRLAAEGVDWFGVALPEEGCQLREAGITQPILSLGGFWPGQEAVLLREKIAPVVYRLDMAEALDRAAQEAGTVAPFHVKIDTGMGRLGVRYEAAAEFADGLKRFQYLRLEGLMTHFAAADAPALDDFTRSQIQRYETALGAFQERGFNPHWRDLSNSAGIYGYPAAHGNLARAGGVLYGLWRDVLPPGTENNLRPVMALRSRIELLKRVPKGAGLGYGCTRITTRESLIATLPIGYNDGYSRALSNQGRVIVRGQYAPVAGRVSMDMTLIDVTDVPGVALHDTVTLLGADGPAAIAAEDIAAQTGTISYEITCGVSSRVPRIEQSARPFPAHQKF